MQFKEYSVYVGHDHNILTFDANQSGKIPKYHILEWLNETIGLDNWQYDYEPHVAPMIKNSDMIDVIRDINAHPDKSGATFYFGSDEDRLLFCLKWVNTKKETVFWHPV
jgi:hypothetical protein